MLTKVISAVNQLMAARKKHKGILLSDKVGNVINDTNDDNNSNSEHKVVDITAVDITAVDATGVLPTHVGMDISDIPTNTPDIPTE